MEYEEVEVNSERWFDLTPLLNEEFKDIKGYEEMYQVSNYGRVKSLSRFHNNNGKGYISKDIIFKVHFNMWGYPQCILRKSNISKTKTIHRLVMTEFILNPDNLPQVNHIDGNKKNNRIDNLEWCSRSHNIKEAFRLGLMKPHPNSKGKFDENNKLSKKILQLDIYNKPIKVWNSFQQIKRETNFSIGNICECCKKNRNQANGYKWEYYKKEEN